MSGDDSDRVRKFHRKSRNGCLSCKRLRIKCDESKPQCEYCQERGRECTYPTPFIKRTKHENIDILPSSSEQSSDSGVVALRRPFKSTNDLDKLTQWVDEWGESWNEQSVSDSMTIADSFDFSHILGIPAKKLEVLDFFVKNTSIGLSLQVPHVAQMWSNHGLSIISASPAVSQGVLALTCYHMSCSFPNRQDLEDEAINHYAKAVRNLQSELKVLNRNNIATSFVASTLVLALALTHQSVAPLVSIKQDTPDLFGLARGSYELANNGAEHIANTIVAPLLWGERSDVKIPYYELPFVKRLIVHLNEIRADLDENEFKIYQDTLDLVQLCCQRGLYVNPRSFTLMLIMGSSYEFAELARNARPFALLLCTYFCCLFRISHAFFLDFDPWPRQFKSIAKHLPEDWQPHLRFPRVIIEDQTNPVDLQMIFWL